MRPQIMNIFENMRNDNALSIQKRQRKRLKGCRHILRLFPHGTGIGGRCPAGRPLRHQDIEQLKTRISAFIEMLSGS
ncbi:MAG: hypothetical protein WC601_06555 [Desulfotomaculaceae bacterium]